MDDDNRMAVPTQEDSQAVSAPDPLCPVSLSPRHTQHKAWTVKSDGPEIKSMLSYSR